MLLLRIALVHRLSIRANASRNYTIDDRLFALGDIEILILDNGYFVDQIFLRNYQRDILENYPRDNYKTYNINIKINDNGYEVSYY